MIMCDTEMDPETLWLCYLETRPESHIEPCRHKSIFHSIINITYIFKNKAFIKTKVNAYKLWPDLHNRSKENAQM